MRSFFRLFPFLFILLFMVGPAFAMVEPPSEAQAIAWGGWSGGQGDSFSAPAEGVTVCAASAVELRSLRDDAVHRFEPGLDAPECLGFAFEQAFALDGAQEEVFLAVLRSSPRILDRPAVAPLGDEGSAVLVRGVGPSGSVSVPSGHAGLVALSWPSLVPLDWNEEGTEWQVEALEGEDVLVVVAGEPRPQVLRWSQPVWFAAAPNMGQVLVPVVLALMVSLFRGGAGGAFVRPGKPREPEDSGSGSTAA
jgi:hypothetical protein